MSALIHFEAGKEEAARLSEKIERLESDMRDLVAENQRLRAERDAEAKRRANAEEILMRALNKKN